MENIIVEVCIDGKIDHMVETKRKVVEGVAVIQYQHLKVSRRKDGKLYARLNYKSVFSDKLPSVLQER